MSQPILILILLVLLVPLWHQLRRDFVAGICYAVFLCVSMPTFLRVAMPGSLPQLTIYRLVLLIVFLFWISNRVPDRRIPQMPLFGAFCFWSLANLFSVLLTSASFVMSLKTYLDFVLEIGAFFLLLVTGLRGREEALRVLRAACLGVTLVAVLAFVEKYSGFNPVSYLVAAGPPDFGSEYTSIGGGVTAAYQHRILLGTGMAMGWPLALALMLGTEPRSRQRRLLWVAVALLLAASYFSNSRGPWLAAFLAGATLMWLGGPVVRRQLKIVTALALTVLLLKPGVWTTLFKSAEVTIQADSFKGGTFYYRLELWKVAWNRITESPERFLFGYGPGCGMESTIEWSLSYRGGQGQEIWSWDNQLAYDLYQSGMIGFAASLILYGGVLLGVFRLWRQSPPEDQPFFACLLASLVAYSFMLTNVLMFTKPVNFLFWTTAAVALLYGLTPPRLWVVNTADDYQLEPELVSR